MSDNKKYYYLKLKDTFFDSDAMIILESMPDGYKYSNILLKLYLRSLKGEGKLMFNDRIPYNSTVLAQVTRHSVGDIEKAIQIFQDLDLIEILDNGAIYITDIQSFIGESSTEADRKREYRNRIGNERKNTNGQMSGQLSDKSPDKSPPEIERELEKELELDIERDIVGQSPQSDKSDDVPYKEIVDYLNQKIGSQYRASGKKTKSLIKARWNESFNIDDFKNVIDIKSSQWLNDQNMEKYLRPETLFGTKFESYLNEKTGGKKDAEFDFFS